MQGARRGGSGSILDLVEDWECGSSWRNGVGAEAGQVAGARVGCLCLSRSPHITHACLGGRWSCNSLTWRLIHAELPQWTERFSLFETGICLSDV